MTTNAQSLTESSTDIFNMFWNMRFAMHTVVHQGCIARHVAIHCTSQQFLQLISEAAGLARIGLRRLNTFQSYREPSICPSIRLTFWEPLPCGAGGTDLKKIYRLRQFQTWEFRRWTVPFHTVLYIWFGVSVFVWLQNKLCPLVETLLPSSSLSLAFTSSVPHGRLICQCSVPVIWFTRRVVGWKHWACRPRWCVWRWALMMCLTKTPKL